MNLINKCGTTAGYRQHYTNKTKPCEACKAAQKAYNEEYKKTRKPNLETRRKWREANKDKIKAQRSRYREKHKDQINARSLAWRNENKELANSMTKAWKEANLDKHRSYKRKSQNKRRSAYSEDYLESDVISLYGSICYICNKEIDLLASRPVGAPGWQNGLHIDHVVPLSKGGHNTLENVRPTHGICNISKGDKLI